MQLKKIHPIHVLSFETKTSLNQISDHVRVVARRLYQEAVRNDLEITGPIYWIYEGADGQPDTIFNLTIALPVTPDSEITNTEFKTQDLGTFDCLTDQLFGEWSGLGNIYGRLISEVMSKNLVLSGVNREIYLNIDFEHPERNITEVQIGIVK